MPPIECEWMRDRRLLVNPDGQVLPCCYFANSMYTFAQTNELHPLDRYNMKLLNDYYKEKDKYNIFNRSLDDIINEDWFTKALPKSWEKEETTCELCIRNCTKEG